MKDFLKRQAVRVLLIVTFPFWPMIVLFSLIWDARGELLDAIADYYDNWLEAFRTGGQG